MPHPEAKHRRDRGQAHALFTPPQPPTRARQPQSVEQQTNDKDPLKPGDTHDGQDVPPILLPHRRLAEPDSAVRRQICLCDPPSPQLPPVKLRLAKFLRRGLDIARRRALEDLRGDLGRLPAECVNREERSANDAGAQLIVVLPKYRRVGYGVQPGQDVLLSIGKALRINTEIADAGGRAATRFWISPNDRSFMKTDLTRPANGPNA